MEYNVGMLNARCFRLQGPRTREKLLRRVASPLPTSYWVWGALYALPCRVRGVAVDNFEFGAFWHLKIASKQCDVAMKLSEGV